jgi:hypothetical protein
VNGKLNEKSLQLRGMMLPSVKSSDFNIPLVLSRLQNKLSAQQKKKDGGQSKVEQE